MKLKNESEWREYSKSGSRPNDIPSNPNGTYKNNGWKGWGDWLGTKNKKGGWLLFEDARAVVHTLKLLNQREWREYCKSGLRPSDIPAMPSRVYKDKGWISLGDWIGKL